MLVHCFTCASTLDVAASAGATGCTSCGELLVWPVCATAPAQANEPTRETQSRERAQRRLALYALRYGVMPWTLARIIEDREERDHIYARIGWQLEQRTPTLRHGPAPGARARDVSAPPNPAQIDPWGCDPARLPTETRRVVVCPSCAGTKKIVCRDCEGVGRLRCLRCLGSGKVMGKKRLENCPSCRGRGDRDCPACTNGRRGCPTCQQSGRVHAWIEIVSQRFVTITVRAGFEVEQAHPDVRDPADLDRARTQLPADLIADTSWCAPSETWQLPADLTPSLDRRTQRVIGVRAQALFTPGTRFTYATRWRRAAVELAGYPPRPVDGGELGPLRTRALGSVGAGVVTAVAGAALLGAYVERSDWFVAHGNGAWLVLLTAVAAIASLFASLGATLPAHARSRLRWIAPLAVLVATLLAGVVAWISAGPSVEVAQQALAAGDLERADSELRGLADLHLVDPQADALVAELADARGRQADASRLRRVDSAPNVQTAAATVREPWHDPNKRALARARLSQLGGRAVELAWPNKDAFTLREVGTAVHGLDDALASRARGLATLADAANCIGQADWPCARARLAAVDSPKLWRARTEVLLAFAEALVATIEQLEATGHQHALEFDARSSALEQALVVAGLYEEVFGEPCACIDLAEVERSLESIAAEIERERKQRERAEAEEQRQRERERKAAERKAKREAKRERERKAAKRRAWNANRVRCRDGTYSRSCTCDRSWQGCCSHHGGVAGCGDI